MDLLEVKNISKIYGTGEATVHALKQATFSVPKGEFVAVVGGKRFVKGRLPRSYTFFFFELLSRRLSPRS